MTRSRLVRLLGFALSLAAGFASPASALAHGHAHEHEAEEQPAAHQVDAHRETGTHHHGDATRDLVTQTVTSADRHDGDHPHAAVDAALITKSATAFVVVLAASIALPSPRVVTVAPPLPERALQFRVEAAHAPPPHLRAPPSLLG